MGSAGMRTIPRFDKCTVMKHSDTDKQTPFIPFYLRVKQNSDGITGEQAKVLGNLITL